MIPHVPPLQLLLHVALLSVLTVPSSALRAVVVTDVHLDPLYDATASKSCFCRSECRAPRELTRNSMDRLGAIRRPCCSIRSSLLQHGHSTHRPSF